MNDNIYDETKLLEEIHDFFNSEYMESSSNIFIDILKKDKMEYILNEHISNNNLNKKRNKPNMSKVNRKKKKRYH